MRLKLFLISSVIIILSGCCEPQVEYRDRWKEVKVPVKCAVPDTNCTWTGNDSLLAAQMYACILQMKEDIKVCQ